MPFASRAAAYFRPFKIPILLIPPPFTENLNQEKPPFSAKKIPRAYLCVIISYGDIFVYAILPSEPRPCAGAAPKHANAAGVLPSASQERGIRPSLAALSVSLHDVSIGECTLYDSKGEKPVSFQVSPLSLCTEPYLEVCR